MSHQIIENWPKCVKKNYKQIKEYEKGVGKGRISPEVVKTLENGRQRSIQLLLVVGMFSAWIGIKKKKLWIFNKFLYEFNVI